MCKYMTIPNHGENKLVKEELHLKPKFSLGGALVFKVGYDAHTRKQVKGSFFPTIDVSAYIEKGVKNGKIWKKGYVFQPLKL